MNKHLLNFLFVPVLITNALRLPIRTHFIFKKLPLISFTRLHSKKCTKDNTTDSFMDSLIKDNIIAPKKMNNDVKLKSLAPLYKPRGKNQEAYVNYLNDPNVHIVLGVGPAGSGKTLFACYTAIQDLKKGKIQKIIMTRPLISVDKEDIGFLPGNMVNKMDPWTRPIFDILLEFFTQRDIDVMINSGVIEISPLAYMRGRTFKNAFIIADEMQNSSPNQMLMMTTRIGQGTKLVITGDLKQSDRQDENGLLDFMTKIKSYDLYLQKSHIESNNTNEPQIKLVELKVNDIERSPIVAKILDIYKGKKSEPTSPNPSSLSTSFTLTPSFIPSQTNISTNSTQQKPSNKVNDAALIPIEHYEKIMKYYNSL